MKKTFGLFITMMVVLNLAVVTALAIESPLKKYNLYDDVMGDGADTTRERVTGDYFANSLRPGSNVNKGTGVPTQQLNNVSSISDIKAQSEADFQVQGTRNETLRQSSTRTYANVEMAPDWETAKVFYSNPTFDSIKTKYKMSNFAGCLQESIAYVRKYPHDSLGYYYLAMSYSKVNDKENAIKAYEKVIALHDSPMLVKYATNGRNCVLGGAEECFPNVNEPEYIRPYESLNGVDLTPVDPQEFIYRNLQILDNERQVKEALAKAKADANKSPEEKAKEGKQEEVKINLPFGDQNDESLDRFIRAPYGNGLSPEVNNQYQQSQLKRLQQTINKDNGSKDKEKEIINQKEIMKFDKHKSDLGSVKLAYEDSFDALQKDPEYIRQKQEFESLSRMLGGEDSNKATGVNDILPYLSEQGNGQKLSPETIQMLMMQSLMGSVQL